MQALEPEMEWILNEGKKEQPQYGSAVDPPNELRWDIDGTRVRDGVDPKLKSKSYNLDMHLELDPDLELTPNDLQWGIDGTGARDGVDPKWR